MDSCFFYSKTRQDGSIPTQQRIQRASFHQDSWNPFLVVAMDPLFRGLSSKRWTQIREEKEETSWNSMIRFIGFAIREHLDLVSILLCRRVSKDFRAGTDEESFWERLFRKTFIVDPSFNTKCWRLEFLHSLSLGDFRILRAKSLLGSVPVKKDLTFHPKGSTDPYNHMWLYLKTLVDDMEPKGLSVLIRLPKGEISSKGEGFDVTDSGLEIVISSKGLSLVSDQANEIFDLKRALISSNNKPILWRCGDGKIVYCDIVISVDVWGTTMTVPIDRLCRIPTARKKIDL